MAKETDKRELVLESIDGLQAEINHLLNSGYESRGDWSLGQACFHLAEWTRYPMDGFPKPPLPLRMIFGVMKMCGIMKRMKDGILRDGFKAGTPTAPQTAPSEDSVADAEGVAKLTEVLQRMKDFDGPLQPSPVFGEMDRELWTQVTLLHAQHHLAFLVPAQT